MGRHRRDCWATQRLATTWIANNPKTGINGISSGFGVQGL